ncbi:MAG: Bor family protein [Longimicrobiales bacterium]|nr:Bor family protein [Longimicrobiales bacterium]
MRTPQLAGLTLLLLGTAGCLEHTYTSGAGAPEGPVVYRSWHSHWLGGLIGEKNVTVEEHCPSGNATIHDEQTFLNGLVTAVTFGIYAPTRATIRCDEGTEVNLELTGGEVVMILASPRFLDRVEAVIPERLPDAELGQRALLEERQE